MVNASFFTLTTRSLQGRELRIGEVQVKAAVPEFDCVLQTLPIRKGLPRASTFRHLGQLLLRLEP